LDLKDKTLACHDCKAEYVFSVEEQQEYLAIGHRHPPKRCPACRAARAERKAAKAKEREATSANSYSSATRKMYQIVCSECGKETQVPFEPKAGRPVYCSDCYHKSRNSSSNN